MLMMMIYGIMGWWKKKPCERFYCFFAWTKSDDFILFTVEEVGNYAYFNLYLGCSKRVDDVILIFLMVPSFID